MMDKQKNGKPFSREKSIGDVEWWSGGVMGMNKIGVLQYAYSRHVSETSWLSDRIPGVLP